MREYALPEPLKVSFDGLLPGHERPEKFVEAWCVLFNKAGLEVIREMTESDITLLAPCLSYEGTCTWLDKGGNRSCGNNAGECLSMTCNQVITYHAWNLTESTLTLASPNFDPPP